jgi:hypothetical protein
MKTDYLNLARETRTKYRRRRSQWVKRLTCIPFSISFILISASPVNTPDPILEYVKPSIVYITVLTEESTEMPILIDPTGRSLKQDPRSDILLDGKKVLSIGKSSYKDPEPYMSMTALERELIAEQVAIEAESASLRAKCLVAQCILDRTETKSASDGTIIGTLTSPGQFDRRDNYKINQEIYEAIDMVFVDGYRATDKRVIFFCSPAHMDESTKNWFYSFELIEELDGLSFFTGDKIN